MKNGLYWITFRRIGDEEDSIVLLDKKWKLIRWLLTTGLKCKAVLIAFVEED